MTPETETTETKTTKEVECFTDDQKCNFLTLKRAFKNGDAALVACYDVRLGKIVPHIAAISKQPNGDVGIVPLAVLVEDDPFEYLRAPKPGGGYVADA